MNRQPANQAPTSSDASLRKCMPPEFYRRPRPPRFACNLKSGALRDGLHVTFPSFQITCAGNRRNSDTYISGQIRICLILSVLYAVGFALCGVPLWPLAALLVAFSHLIPMFGPVIAISAVAGLTLAPHYVYHGMGAMGGFGGAQGLEGFYLAPHHFWKAAEITGPRGLCRSADRQRHVRIHRRAPGRARHGRCRSHLAVPRQASARRAQVVARAALGLPVVQVLAGL